jgi:hypothetical protein
MYGARWIHGIIRKSIVFQFLLLFVAQFICGYPNREEKYE